MDPEQRASGSDGSQHVTSKMYARLTSESSDDHPHLIIHRPRSDISVRHQYYLTPSVIQHDARQPLIRSEGPPILDMPSGRVANISCHLTGMDAPLVMSEGGQAWSCKQISRYRGNLHLPSCDPGQQHGDFHTISATICLSRCGGSRTGYLINS